MKIVPPVGAAMDGLHFLDENGHEVMDPTPVAPPLGWTPTPSIIDHIRNLVRQEMSRQAEEDGFESFDEADDFSDDDDDPSSPYEEQFEPSTGAPAAPAAPAPQSPQSPAPSAASEPPVAS